MGHKTTQANSENDQKNANDMRRLELIMETSKMKKCNDRSAIHNLHYHLLISCALLLVTSGLLLSSTALAYDGICRSSADVTNLPPLHWCEVENSQLNDVEKKPNQYADWNGSSSTSYNSFQRNLGVKSITSRWNGAAYDDQNDRMIIWGGGHNAYGGNEIYAFNVRNLSWSRVTDPTTFPNRSPQYKNNDGTPISRHTYDGLTYISHTNELFAMGGAPDSAAGGCGVNGTWIFSFNTNKWTEMQPSGSVPGTSCEDNAIYDPINKEVLFYKKDIRAYKRETNSFSLKSNANKGERRSHIIDPIRRLLIQVGKNDSGSVTRKASLDNLGSGFTNLNTSGARSLENIQNPGLAFDIASDRVVGWYGGSTVYSLNLDNNQWTAHSALSSNKATPPSVTTYGGVYGRFRYSPTLNVFIMVNETNQSVYLYRLSEGGGIPQDVIPPAKPTSLQVN